MRGFTLIELMIVIAIVGILAAILIPIFHGKGSGDISGSKNTTVFTASGRITEVCIGGYKVYQTDKAITQKLGSDGKPERC